MRSRSRLLSLNKLFKKRWEWSKKLTKWFTKTMSRSALTNSYQQELRAHPRCPLGNLYKIIVGQVPVPNNSSWLLRSDSRIEESLQQSRNVVGHVQTGNQSSQSQKAKMFNLKRSTCCRRKRIDTRPSWLHWGSTLNCKTNKYWGWVKTWLELNRRHAPYVMKTNSSKVRSRSSKKTTRVRSKNWQRLKLIWRRKSRLLRNLSNNWIREARLF